MPDQRIEMLADVISAYSLRVQPGDRVILRAAAVAEPLVKALFVRIIKAGGHPLSFVSLPGLDEALLKLGSDEQLQYIHEPVRVIYDTYDAMVVISGTVNTKSLTNVDPDRLKVASQSHGELLQHIINRMADGDLRYLNTQFPTHASAQDADMSLDEYEDFVYGACLPDPEDPIGYWKAFSASQQRIVDWLDGKKEIKLIGPETDLTLSIAGRPFLNCDGRLNMPDGEVCVSPVEDSVEGSVYFSYPANYMGREITGIRLWFERGQVVKATADKGQSFLQKILDTDSGARFLGELGIGTNIGINRYTGNILFDEKISGSFHLALGAGLPEIGGLNQSSIHWDIVCDLRSSGEIWVDDTLFYKDGQFAIDFSS